MLELTPPLWLFTTRPGDTPVPESERHRLGAAIRARIDGSAQSDTALVLSSRLAERVRAVGQFPTEAEEIVRGALRELGLRPPLRITVEAVDENRAATGEPFEFDGAGFPLEEGAESTVAGRQRFSANRSGYRSRVFETRLGALDLRIPCCAGFVLPALPGAAQTCREGARIGGPGGIHLRHLDARGG